MVPKSGPFLSVAAFCEKVLHEQDGVLTPVRLVDRVIHGAVGPDVSDDMPPVPVRLPLLLSLKSGEARGRHTLVVRPEAPSGQQLPETSFPVLLEGGDRGVNIVAQMDMNLDQEGLWWFDIILEPNILLTRVPLTIVYQPQRTTG